METTINAMKGKICDIMTVVVVTVDMQDTVHRVEEILNEHNISSVPVIDPEIHDCFGIISLKDIAHFHAAKNNAKAIRAWEICSYKPLTASPESSIDEVARLMVEHLIHHVVIEENGLLKGLVSSLDIVAACLPLMSNK